MSPRPRAIYRLNCHKGLEQSWRDPRIESHRFPIHSVLYLRSKLCQADFWELSQMWRSSRRIFQGDTWTPLMFHRRQDTTSKCLFCWLGILSIWYLSFRLRSILTPEMVIVSGQSCWCCCETKDLMFSFWKSMLRWIYAESQLQSNCDFNSNNWRDITIRIIDISIWTWIYILHSHCIIQWTLIY